MNHLEQELASRSRRYNASCGRSETTNGKLYRRSVVDSTIPGGLIIETVSVPVHTGGGVVKWAEECLNVYRTTLSAVPGDLIYREFSHRPYPASTYEDGRILQAVLILRQHMVLDDLVDATSPQ